MESKDADRSQVTRRDHVDAVVAAIDSVEPADGKVVLVGQWPQFTRHEELGQAILAREGVQLAIAQQVLDEHLTSSVDGRCLNCGAPGRVTGERPPWSSSPGSCACPGASPA